MVVLLLATVAEAALPAPTDAQAMEAFFAGLLWLLKIVGGLAGAVIMWYARRVTSRLEKVFKFVEDAPDDAWKLLEQLRLERAVEEELEKREKR